MKPHDVLFIERAAYFNSVKATIHECLNAYWRDRMKKENSFFFFWRDRVDKNNYMQMQ